MAEHETIADIIAEMRRGTRLPGYWHSCDVNAILQYHADRLDAARKRERGDAAKLREALAKIRSEAYECDQGGEYLGEGPDPAFERIIKMCDAALATLDLAETKRKEADRLEAAHRRECGDAAKLREALEHMVRAETCGSMERDDLCGRCLEKMFARCKHDGTCWVDKAITALAAPPRNCDLAQDWIRDIYAHFQPPASVKREMPPEWVDAVMAFCRWLVAPATEQEGGAK